MSTRNGKKKKEKMFSCTVQNKTRRLETLQLDDCAAV
jgi:hypothetical protein